MRTQQQLPKLLKQNNLEINTKTIIRNTKTKATTPLWSALDWLTNYKPTVKDTTPNWGKSKLLGSYLGTEEDIEN